jgi:adenosylcobyric acid synthase
MVTAGVPVIGICGGYQMLGEEIHDPYHTESDNDSITALGLLPVTTTFAQEKVTHQIEAQGCGFGLFGGEIATGSLTGYEIHMGRTDFLAPVTHSFHIKVRSRQAVDCQDGVIREDGLVLGTYIHGIFDNDDWRRGILNQLRDRRGWAPLPVSTVSTYQQKEASYNQLADTVREAMDMEKLYNIMGLTPKRLDRYEC